MTEDNKDLTPPKLKLSRTPKETDSADQAGAEENVKPTPSMKLKRPDAEQQSAKPEKSELNEPSPPLQISTPRVTAESQIKPTDERPHDSETPIAGVDAKKPKVEEQPPPNQPSKPETPASDGRGRNLEETVNRIDDEEKSRGILTSIMVILVLLALLGGSGYGLYYILQSPTENGNPSSSEDGKAVDEATEKESDGLLSGPIARAKDTIAKIPGSEIDMGEGTSTSTAGASIKNNDLDSAGTAPAANSSRTGSAPDFLRDAHIGGVRTGDRPKLILNGKSYEKGDMVDTDTGLSFIGFHDKKLAFRDAQGIVYVKSF